MTDTTAQHIAARDDEDLVARLVAAAEQAHIPEPAQFVRTNIGKIISTPIEGTSTITTVYAYAAQVRADAVAQLPLPAGINPAAVTDAQLTSAISAVWAPEG